MNKTFWLLPLIALAILSACSSEKEEIITENKPKEIAFSSYIDGGLATRVYDSNWDAQDAIGVFMKESNKVFDSSAIMAETNNSKFVTQRGDGSFKSIDGAKQFPADNKAVDFIAYYPYSQDITNNMLNVDVSNQENQKSIDLLYSDNLKQRSSKTGAGMLSFVHKLSFLKLTITESNNFNADNLVVSLKDINTQGQMNLANGEVTAGADKGTIVLKKEGRTYKAILIPVSNLQGVKLSFSLNNKVVEKNLSEYVSSLESGKRYNISITISNDEVNVEKLTYKSWTETPIITKAQQANSKLHYITHQFEEMTDPVIGGRMRNYSMLYDEDLKFSYWVAYPLFSAAISKQQNRTDKWAFDPAISSTKQANLKSGFGSTYDRGHQIPSGDRTSEYFANASTFYYTNMTPQIGRKLNQTIWQSLEEKVRSWVSGTDTVFVVTGAMPAKSGEVERIKGMAIPEYYYKALARKIGGKFYTIAFKLNNEEYSDRNFWQGVMSVKELESITGFTFFPTLSDEAKNLDQSKWR